jgi:hypothetical protein
VDTDSKSIRHSTSDQDFQWRELLKQMDLMLHSDLTTLAE